MVVAIALKRGAGSRSSEVARVIFCLSAFSSISFHVLEKRFTRLQSVLWAGP